MHDLEKEYSSSDSTERVVEVLSKLIKRYRKYSSEDHLESGLLDIYLLRPRLDKSFEFYSALSQ